MAKINDGGPAFPMLWNSSHNSEWEIEGGMSQRAYIATQIAAGMVAHSGPDGFHFGSGQIANRACDIADALIARLAEGGAE